MKHSQSFEVRFAEADQRSLLTPLALFNYLQETAIRHSDSVNMDGDNLAEMGYAWMMNRIRMKIDRYPLRRETVHVETWASSLHGRFAVREWRVMDAEGAQLACATTRWIMLDLNKRTIIKLPKIVFDKYGEHEDRVLDEPFARMIPIESGNDEKHFHVRLSELDSNQHANSGAYLDWSLEAVPPDVLSDYLPCDIQITYKKESKLGDGLIAYSLEEPPEVDGNRAFQHVIRLQNDGTVLAIAKSEWQKVE